MPKKSRQAAHALLASLMTFAAGTALAEPLPLSSDALGAIGFRLPAAVAPAAPAEPAAAAPALLALPAPRPNRSLDIVRTAPLATDDLAAIVLRPPAEATATVESTAGPAATQPITIPVTLEPEALGGLGISRGN